MAEVNLPENAFNVTIMHMVDPSTFWVTEPPADGMSKEKEELLSLEEMLTQHCRRSSYSLQRGNYTPEEGELVAVQHPDTGRWHRAAVECVLHTSKGYSYQVFLVDHGHPLQVRSSSIRELPPMWNNLDYQSFQVILDSIVPTTMDMDYEDMEMKRVVTSHWTAASMKYMKKLLENYTNAWVVPVNFEKNKKKIYGELFVEVLDTKLSLSDELCKEEYASVSKEDFERAQATNVWIQREQIEAFCKSNTSIHNEDSSSQSSSSVPSMSEKIKHMHIREYIQDSKNHYSKREEQYLNGTSEVVEDSEKSQEINNQDETLHDDIPLGRGLPKNRRKSRESFPSKEDCSTPLKKSDQSDSSFERKTKMSPMLGLLDFIDNKSEQDLSESDNKVVTEEDITCKSPFNNSNNSNSGVEFIPAGRISASKIKDKKENTTRTASISSSHCNESDRIMTPEKRQGIVMKKPLSECVKERTNRSVSKEGNTVMQGSNLLQNIVKNVTKQTEREELFDKICTVPNMSARLPQAALQALSKRETKNDASSGSPKPANSNLSTDRTVLSPEQTSGLCAGYRIAERLHTSRILVHGDMGSRAIQSIAEANFPKEIHQALGQMDFKDPKRIQMYVWPAIVRGQYTVLVGPPECGKTLAYIVPLLSLMMTPDVYSELRQGSGPLVLILCSGSKSAQFVYDTFLELLRRTNQTEMKLEIAYGGGREEDLKLHLVNGCDILISTPRCFLRLFKCSRHITNMDRVAHLVLDEVDILSEKFLPELKQIIAECKRVLKQRAKSEIPIQVIAASERWCPSVEQFTQNISQNFLVCISGYLEAAVYAKLHPELHILSASEKAQRVLDILDGHQGLHKTLIVCESLDEVDELEPFLKSQCYHVLKAHEGMTQYHNKDVYYNWKRLTFADAYPVLVCTDDILPELEVYDALWLIHYSLPRTKTGFGFRFSCLMNNYRNIFQKSTVTDNTAECKVHIFIDKDQNAKELPEVVNFMKRLSVPISSEVEAKVLEVLRQKESKKQDAPLCYYVKAFGVCTEKSGCKSRHMFLDCVDKPNVPTCGEVKVKILHVHDASYFSARLLEHTDVEGKTVAIPHDYFTISMSVYTYYTQERNRQVHGIPKLGDICALEGKVNTFQRVRVEEFVKQNRNGIPEEVKVRFLDEGTVSVVKVFQLLALPEDLQKLPPQVVDIFLCSLMPCDLDTNWNETASCKMNDWINEINDWEEDGKFLIGKVMLGAGNTMWLHPLKCCNYLSGLETYVTEIILHKELLKYHLAVNNPSHLENLYKLCEAGGLAVPSCNKVASQKTTTPSKEVLQSSTVPKIAASPVTPQWAYLDTENYQEVIFICANNPHQFFIRQSKFEDSFQKLVNELQKCDKTKPKGFQVEKGKYCLGKFPDDKLWYRAKVDELLEGDMVSLFFVDHGDHANVSMDNIAPIKDVYLWKLPFQAIECSLAGVQQINGTTWSEEAIDEMYAFSDCGVVLYTKVCAVLESAPDTGMRCYRVLLIDTSTPFDVMLNTVLLEKCLVSPSSVEEIPTDITLIRETEEQDVSEGSDDEPESQIIKITDLNFPIETSSCHGDTSDDEGFDFQIGNVSEFLSKAARREEAELLLNMMGIYPRGNMLEYKPDVPNEVTTNLDTSEEVGAPCVSSQYSSTEEDSDDEEYIPPCTSTTRTPQVLWCQDESIIDIKINIPGVENYYIAWDMECLQFRVKKDDQVYEVILDLFGPFDATNVAHLAKGLFVHVKLLKVVYGHHWPRLLHSQYKRPWLKLDLEKYKADDGSDEDIEARCERAIRELSIPEKRVKSPGINLKDEEIIPDILVDASDDDSGGSDSFEPPDHPYDPFDPLN